MMVHRLKDNVVVLTGASSGIGASIAEHLLKEGAKVRREFMSHTSHTNGVI
jgi:NADP-dependent 3-hydroxy acid dehydrogenase YdfG